MNSNLLPKSLTINLTAILFTITLTFFPALSSGNQEEFAVFFADIQTATSEEGDPIYTKNIYIKGGQKNGLKESSILDVYRNKKVRDLETDQEFLVKIHVGQINVVSLHKDVAITRIVSLASNKDTHFLRYRTVMKGDLAILKKDEVKEENTSNKDKTISSIGRGITSSSSGVHVPSNILFDFEGWKLKPEALEVLSVIFDTYNESKNMEIVVEGHTCSLGEAKFNLELSKKRAQSVSDYLKENKGVPEDLILIEYYGESDPIASNDTETGRRKNRRVEIRFQESAIKESN